MQLRLGVMTNKQLAEWFGISFDTFKHSKEKRLEELKMYADYTLVGDKTKKIKIKQIYEPVYYKKGSKNYEIIKSKLDSVWSKDGLDSCKRVCYEILETTDLTIADTTAYRYTLQSRNDLFGKPFQEAGTLGSCRYVWCKQDENGNLRFLSKQEEEIKAFLIKKYFGDATQKQIIVQGMVESGEIGKEQAWDMLTKMTNMKGSNFLAFLNELQKKLECKVIRGTFVERIEDKKGAF